MHRAALVSIALLSAGLYALAQDINNPQTNASALSTGTVAAARGGAGTINGALKGNGSGAVSQAASTDLSDCSAPCLITAAKRTLPTTQQFTSGTAATYTTPANVLWIRIRMVGAGGSGGGGGTGSPGNGVDGGATTFSGGSLSAAGGKGSAGSSGVGAAGGALPTGCSVLNSAGNAGSLGTSSVTATISSVSGTGAGSLMGGGGVGAFSGNAGVNAIGYGGGGGGGASSSVASAFSAGGAGAGAYCEHIINSPAATYTYTIGAGQTGGAAGTNGTAGGNSFGGYLVVEEYYNS